MVRNLRPPADALDIELETSEQFDRTVQTEAPTLKQLEFVIKPFDA